MDCFTSLAMTRLVIASEVKQSRNRAGNALTQPFGLILSLSKGRSPARRFDKLGVNGLKMLMPKRRKGFVF